MKLEVHGDGYLAAADAFATANHRAAVCHDRLVGRLAGFAGMAGDDSSSQEFAASYDEAAREALAALADLADACAGLGRLTHASLANHLHAEARSVVGGSAVSDDGPPAGAGYVVVLPATTPGSLGANPPSLPGPVSWILDHLEGVVWPGADVARLRSAAETWHAAAAGLTDLEECFDSALRGLWGERSPEIPRAIEATHELRGAARGLGERYAALAVACEAYADHVEAKRAEMLHLAEWLLEQVVEGILISAAIGALTAGAGTAAGLSAVAARIAAESPAFLRILEALRALAASTASGVRVTREGLSAVRLTLTKFRSARVASADTAAALRTVDHLAGLSRTVSRQRQLRHVRDTQEWIRNGKGGYFERPEDAQTVLDGLHHGSATVLGETRNGNLIVKFDEVIGFNNNPGAGFMNQPTNIFIIKGTTKPSVVPTNPTLEVVN